MSKNRDKLIVDHLPLVHSIVSKLVGKSHSSVHDIEDLIGIGTVGLINAVDNYSTSHGTLLRTYARRKIVGAILDYFRKEDHLSRNSRLKHKRIESAKKLLEHELGRTVYPAEISGRIDVELDDYHKVIWESDLHLKPSEEIGTANVVSCLLDQPENILITMQLIERFGSCILALPERERVVFSLYYYEALTFREIGDILDLGESRISQIMHSAMTTVIGNLKGGHTAEEELNEQE